MSDQSALDEGLALRVSPRTGKKLIKALISRKRYCVSSAYIQISWNVNRVSCHRITLWRLVILIRFFVFAYCLECSISFLGNDKIHIRDIQFLRAFVTAYNKEAVYEEKQEWKEQVFHDLTVCFAEDFNF